MAPHRIAVEARNLTKVYRSGKIDVTALQSVDVQFFSGQFAAIMGPSGSGKSTLLHVLAGLDAPTSGSVFLDGVDLTGLRDSELTQLRRDRVGFIFQAFNLLPTLTAGENIKLPALLGGTKVERAWFDHLVSTLGLADRLTHKPHELSGGQQQRVAIARALLTKPVMIVADEPTGNLDSRASMEVLDLLRVSVRELGGTVIMVTHDHTAASYAERVTLLSDGQVAGHVEHPTIESINAAFDALRPAQVVGA